MLKSELEDIVGEEFKLEKGISKKVVDVLVCSLINAIRTNDRIEIRGFGSFFPKTYKAYQGRNPKSGEAINVPEKVLPIFRPSKDLISKLNKNKD
ncbi:integration host factor subunit beta [bacterium]|jgi:integration host factor subunit beta|nr:integration host factor subunit beta [bacterium]MDG2005852.1 integration host factor subunit beta [Thermodesulfobacteriota bacterium]